MTVSVVLDVETRIDRASLASSGRSRALKEMPVPLQAVTAGALLTFDLDAGGLFSGFHLESLEGAEPDVAGMAERRLARVYAGGGDLITYNGVHDLGVLRFALLRSRMLGGAGVQRWMADAGGRHRDLMLEVARDGRWPRLVDVAAGLRFAPPLASTAATAADGAEKAELDVALTMLLHIHLVAERLGDVTVLKRGALSFGRFLASNAMGRPHLSAILESPLYAAATRTLSD